MLISFASIRSFREAEETFRLCLKGNLVVVKSNVENRIFQFIYASGSKME